MDVHPRRGGRAITRRAFLRGALGAAIAVPTAGALLEACATSSESAATVRTSLPLARRNHPVRWPIYKDNPPIKSGLSPERNATLKIYNWADYIYKAVVNDFADHYNCKVEISTFNNTDEALSKLRSGELDFDVMFPTIDILGKMVVSQLVQPLNHSYIPNLTKHVWPAFQDPFYDRGWRYTVPYTIYTTGITWRTDFVPDDIPGMQNPYDIFWDTRYKGKIHLLDDYREAMAMVLLRNGITNVNTTSRRDLSLVSRQLQELARKVDPSLDVSDYTDVPEGKAWIHQAWSGDMVSSQYYMPKGQSPRVIRYWYPPDGRGVIGNDLITVLRSARNPVLAHAFLNYMLSPKAALKNMSWNGYQPPQRSIDPNKLVAQGYIPPTLKSAVVRESDFARGFELLELDPKTDALWHDVWQRFKAG